jgi:hypothetical protein
MLLLKKSVDNWYNEIFLYNFNIPLFSSVTGHFTCLIWKSSTSFGFGFSKNLAGEVIISYNCSPPANISGQFSQNVLPPITSVPIPVPIPIPIPPPTPVPIPPPTPVPIPPVNQLCTKTDIINNLKLIRTSVMYRQSYSVILFQVNNLIDQITKCDNISNK